METTAQFFKSNGPARSALSTEHNGYREEEKTSSFQILNENKIIITIANWLFFIELRVCEPGEFAL